MPDFRDVSIPTARLIGLACLLIATAGCSSQRYAEKSKEVVDSPEETTEVEGLGTERWCSDFGKEGLEKTVREAWRENMELKAAWARLEQAKAASDIESSSLWPSIRGEVGGEYSNREFYGGEPSRQAGDGGGEFSWELSAAASYEIPLWGSNRHRARAADLEAEAAEARARSTAITLTSQVAEAWFDVVAQSERIDLLKAQLDVSEDVLEITRKRVRRGLVGALDVNQQEQNLESLRGRLEEARGQLATSRHRLAVLLGESPGEQTLVASETDTLPEIEPLPEAGVPANLLERRPDLRAAHLQLEAADERTAAAVADRLPQLELSANIGFQAEQIADLFRQLFWNVGASLAQPLFEGGRLQAEIERSEAVAEEQLYDYAQTFLTAVREVRDALALETSQREQIESLERERKLAERALKLARERYRSGTADYLRVLTGLQELQEVERALLEARRQQISHRISLCRALGGTWVESVDSSIAENDN